MRPPPYIPPPPPPRTPHAAIAIDGDTNFLTTALLEGWPGDGSPENPYIIDGLEIDYGGADGHCISIRNTRVSFTISNCNLTGARYIPFTSAGAGIFLDNVTNGELVNNICINNGYSGIYLGNSDSTTVVNNTCTSNAVYGIWFSNSNSTMSDNTCNNNGKEGIRLSDSDSSTVTNNTCNNNTECGIRLLRSDSNTVISNTCNNNSIGIYISKSYSNILANNICLDNTEYEIIGEFETEEFVIDRSAYNEFVAKEFVWFLAGCGMILVVSIIAFVQFRRMEI
jgi:parallel beta-helix repeat protein